MHIFAKKSSHQVTLFSKSKISPASIVSGDEKFDEDTDLIMK